MTGMELSLIGKTIKTTSQEKGVVVGYVLSQVQSGGGFYPNIIVQFRDGSVKRLAIPVWGDKTIWSVLP